MPRTFNQRDNLLAAASIVAAASAFLVRRQSPLHPPRNDFDLVCASARVLEAGGNPFDVAQTAAAGGPVGGLLTHPPLLPRLMSGVCGESGLWVAVIAFVSLVFIAWRLMRASPPASIVAAAAGFAAFPWVLLTGNLAMAEAVAVGLACAAMVANRTIGFGLALGPALYVKSLSPLPLLAVAFVRWHPRRATTAVLCAFGVLGGLFAIDALIDPQAAASFWRAAATAFGPWGMRELRFGGEYSPTPFAFLPLLTSHAGLGRGAGYAGATIVAAAFGVAWLRLLRASTGSSCERVWLSLLALGVIAICHPRFKPYSPLVLTPALALALTTLDGVPRRWAIVLACFVPNLLFLSLTTLVWLPALPSPLVFALQYSQWLSLAATVALALRTSTFRMLSGTRAPVVSGVAGSSSRPVI